MTFDAVMEKNSGKLVSYKGFTLIEMLIAISLLGIMMTLLFGAFRIGVRSWDAGERRSAQTSHMLIVQDFLRRHLSATRPLMDDFTDDDPFFSFIGTENELRFVSALPAHGGRGGLFQFMLKLEDEGRGQTTLKIALQPFFPPFDDTDDAERIEDIVLLENVEKFELTYYGKDQLGDDPDWYDQWEEKNELPQLVKLDMQLTEQEPWPPIIVHLRVEATRRVGSGRSEIGP